MANNYGTEAGFGVYTTDRGYTVPAGAVPQALVRATTWIDGTYGARFPGQRTDGRAQPLQWPRTGATDVEGNTIGTTEIPTEVIQATYEAAMRELATPGALSPDVVIGQVKKSVSVSGAVAVTYASEGGVVASQTPILTVVDGILAPLLGGIQSRNSAVKFLSRA